MFLFQPPPATQYDLNFSVAGIPIRVHPLFWLIAILFGASLSLLQLPIWVLVLFISILIHELGHAFAMRFYGQSARIILYHMGGGAIADSVQWGSRWANVALGYGPQTVIALAGPFAGFLLAALILLGVALTGGSIGTYWLFGVIPLPLAVSLTAGGIVNFFVAQMLWVNIFWGLINLLPISPLDGGNVARNILVQYDPRDGLRKSLWLSTVAGGLMALVGFLLWHNLYITLLFGFLAYQSYQSLMARF